MAQKKVWLTWVGAEEGTISPQSIGEKLAQSGLQVVGHPWVDNMPQMAWQQLAALLQEKDSADVWFIASRQQDWQLSNIRYGMSLVAAIAKEARAFHLPSVFLGLDFQPQTQDFPTLLQDCSLLSGQDTAWPAKTVAKAFSHQAHPPAYRLNLRAHPQLGQWFEVGPRADIWQGVMFGVASPATITHHGVGKKGQVPERTVVEYALENMTAQIGDTDFNAWSVQNQISSEDSYYLRVEGYPQKIIFGNHPGTDQEEVYVIQLS